MWWIFFQKYLQKTAYMDYNVRKRQLNLITHSKKTLDCLSMRVTYVVPFLAWKFDLYPTLVIIILP